MVVFVSWLNQDSVVTYIQYLDDKTSLAYYRARNSET